MTRMTRTRRNDETPQLQKSGDKHAWFLEDMPKFKIHVPIVKSATVYLSTFDESKTQVANLLNDLRVFKPDDRITMIFNSPGGLVSEGRAIINAVTATGADIQTELLSEASSMAAVMFCIGDRRIVYENSSLMFHNFSGGVGGKGHEMKDHLKHIIKNIELFFRSYIIGLSDKEIQQMVDGKEFWFGAKKMCERGIATHVNINGILIPAKRYLKALKKAKKIAKKTDEELSTIAEGNLLGIDVMSKIVEEQNIAMDGVTATISSVVSNNEFLYN